MIKVINPGSFSIKVTEEGDGPLEAVAFRIVHGGRFWQPMEITTDLEAEIERYKSVAPIHNEQALENIKEYRSLHPGIPLIAVFDTEFFHDLPDVTKYYALPLNLQQKYGIRRYGFHGISHESAARQVVQLRGRVWDQTSMITIHLGQGSSMTAIVDGRPIDTTMGFSPLEGLMMGTRTGDLDPGIMLYLLEQGLTKEQLSDLINKQSGWMGLTGEKDLRKVIECSYTDKTCELALNMMFYRIQKYLGAFLISIEALGSVCDLVVFTGAIGENEEIRRRIMSPVSWFSPEQIVYIEPRENAFIAERARELLSSKF